jgi:hypothetical protein
VQPAMIAAERVSRSVLRVIATNPSLGS